MRVFFGFLPCMLRTLHSNTNKRASQVRSVAVRPGKCAHASCVERQECEEKHGPKADLAEGRGREKKAPPASFRHLSLALH